MTQAKSVNVPRESLNQNGGSFFSRLLFWRKGRKKYPECARSSRSNIQINGLSPHLLRDIGVLDGKALRK